MKVTPASLMLLLKWWEGDAEFQVASYPALAELSLRVNLIDRTAGLGTSNYPWDAHLQFKAKFFTQQMRPY